MAGLAKATLIGRLGGDPETGQTNNGTNYASFSIAVGDKNKDNTQWFRVTAYNGLSDVVAQYLTKGREVYVEGRLELREWEDRNGQLRTTAQVTANELKMLSGGGNSNAQGRSGNGNGPRNNQQARNGQRTNNGNHSNVRNAAPQNRNPQRRSQPQSNDAGNDYGDEQFDPGPEF
jgi:single-strand DNA-binding protein